MQEINHEELEKALEKAKKDMQEMLDKMTPEERAQAQLKAQKAIEEDRENMQKLIADAAKLTGSPAPAAKPKFCGNCGAPAGSGNFCEYCGKALS